jgi:hypothetical protein
MDPAYRAHLGARVGAIPWRQNQHLLQTHENNHIPTIKLTLKVNSKNHKCLDMCSKLLLLLLLLLLLHFERAAILPLKFKHALTILSSSCTNLTVLVKFPYGN